MTHVTTFMEKGFQPSSCPTFKIATVAITNFLLSLLLIIIVDVVVQFLPFVQFFLNQYKMFEQVQNFLNQYKIF